MRSDVTAAQQTALGATACMGHFFVRLDIVDDPVYVWDGIGDISWDGKTWTGVGSLGSIGAIDTDTKGNIVAVQVSLKGIDSNLLTDIKASKYQGQSAYIYTCPHDLTDFSLIDDPFLLFAGEISDMPVMVGKPNSISVTIESRMAVLQKQRPRYRTDEDQRRDYVTDDFFEYVPKVQNKTIYWGMTQPRSTGGTGATGSRGGLDERLRRLV